MILILALLVVSIEPELVDPSPFHYSTLRIAILADSSLPASTPALYFSPVEHFKGNDTQADLVEVDADNGTFWTHRFLKSIEMRSYCYNPVTNSWILGASLYPQIFELKSGKLRLLFDASSRGETVWFHDIGCSPDGAVWAMSSTSSEAIAKPYLIQLIAPNFEARFYDLPSMPTHPYGGVESIDPKGRIWLYRTSGPLDRIEYWFDPKTETLSQRAVPSLADFEVTRWLQWGESLLFELTKDDQTIFVEDTPLSKVITIPEPFSKLKRLQAETNPLHYRAVTQNGDIFRVSLAKKRLQKLHEHVPSIENGDWLGFTNENELIGWIPHSKTLVRYDLKKKELKQITVKHQSLSSAAISALGMDSKGNLYAGGMMDNDFITLPYGEDKFRSLGKLYPWATGQILNFLDTENGIYFLSYPSAEISLYRSDLQWNAGNKIDSNPISFGESGEEKQDQAYSSTYSIALNRAYFLSESIYAPRRTQALIEINTKTQNRKVTNLTDRGFPFIEMHYDHLEISDDGILFATIEGQNSIIGFDPETFEVKEKWDVGVPRAKFKLSKNTILVADRSRVLIVNRDDSSIQSSPLEITENIQRVLNFKECLIIFGENAIIEWNKQTRQHRILTQSPSGLFEWVYRTAAVSPVNGTIYFGKGSALYRLQEKTICEK